LNDLSLLPYSEETLMVSINKPFQTSTNWFQRKETTMAFDTTLNMSELEDEAASLADRENNSEYMDKFVKMPEKTGSVTVRIMPPAPTGMFGRETKNGLFQATRIHTVNGKKFHCPRVKKMIGEHARWVSPTGQPEDDCPICLYYTYLWKKIEKLPEKSGESLALKAKARAIKPAERYYYNAIVRKQFDSDKNEMEYNLGPKILSIGIGLHNKIILAITGNKKMEIKAKGDITHYLTGRDLQIVKKIEKSGDDEFPNYDESFFLEEATPAAPDEGTFKTWIENLNDLSALRTIKPREELERQLKIHNGVIKDDGDQAGFNASDFEVKASAEAEDAGVTVEAEAPAKTITAAKAKAPAKAAAPKVESTEHLNLEVGNAAAGGDESVDTDALLSRLQNL
jgi:hypothetical protein